VVPGNWRWGVVAALLGAPLAAQELQPRALQNAPVGTNFVIVATGYSHGNLLVDPALPIEDATADVWSVTPGGGVVTACASTPLGHATATGRPIGCPVPPVNSLSSTSDLAASLRM